MSDPQTQGPTLLDCGEGVAVILPGHDDNRPGVAYRMLGKDASHPALGLCVEMWLVRDTEVPGHDEWFWRCSPDHPEAKPFTVWTDQPWPIDIEARGETT